MGSAPSQFYVALTPSVTLQHCENVIKIKDNSGSTETDSCRINKEVRQ